MIHWSNYNIYNFLKALRTVNGHKRKHFCKLVEPVAVYEKIIDIIILLTKLKWAKFI